MLIQQGYNLIDRGCGLYDKLEQSGICSGGKGKIAEGCCLCLKEQPPGTTQNMRRTVAKRGELSHLFWLQTAICALACCGFLFGKRSLDNQRCLFLQQNTDDFAVVLPSKATRDCDCAQITKTPRYFIDQVSNTKRGKNK